MPSGDFKTTNAMWLSSLSSNTRVTSNIRRNKGNSRSDQSLIKILVFTLWVSRLKTRPGDCKTTNAIW